MAAPPLLYSENGVKTETYYVTISLGGNPAPKPVTGIFVPENYNVSSDVDMILWLMGHHDNSEYPPALTIDDYWFKYPHFRFREFVNASNKNVILAAPTLGRTRGPRSIRQCPVLRQPGDSLSFGRWIPDA
jgi:hypothetical protein